MDAFSPTVEAVALGVSLPEAKQTRPYCQRTGFPSIKRHQADPILKNPAILLAEMLRQQLSIINYQLSTT